jgi:arabinofuranan 3-O-arabinosyltransferase
VPTRNSAATLKQCLASLRQQTYKPIEIIVVDNHSTDATSAIAKGVADQVETRGPERSAQRNFGARLARGSYLFFVDSDMILAPAVVADCVAAAADDGVGGVIVPEVSIGQGFWARCRALERSCYTGDDLVEAARFFPRSVFAATGGYDEELVAGEDWDLSIRARAQGRLTRATTTILHDEGKLELRSDLAKKAYYARSFSKYWKKHPEFARRQANLVFRLAYVRHWRTLVKHPALTVGFLTLKSLEQGAALWGLISSRIERPRIKG